MRPTTAVTMTPLIISAVAMTQPLVVPPLPFAAPLTINKYDTLQERRVEVEIAWDGGVASQLRAHEASAFVKDLCPDARVQLVRVGDGREAFYLRVDGKVISATMGAAAFLPRKRILDEVALARRTRRPATVYVEPLGGGGGGDEVPADAERPA